FRGDAAARGTFDKPELEEKRLVDLGNGRGLFGERGRERVDARGPAAKALDEHAKQFSIKRRKPELVYLEHAKRLVDDFFRERRPFKLRQIARALEQVVGGARRGAGALGYLLHAALIDINAENLGGAAHDAFDILLRVELEAERAARKTAAQWRGEVGDARGCGNEGKGRQRQLDGARAGALADDDVEHSALHGGVEHLLYRASEPVDL